MQIKFQSNVSKKEVSFDYEPSFRLVVKYFFGVVVKLKTKQTFEACLLPQVL